ncbi:cation/H(+) antiporter 15-like, partial [Trifolium medium]|nr:cation/H(+) antiporter 15-like [Trifolium medium]
MRPVILWSVARLHGKPIDEVCILCVIVCVLLTAFISEFIGQHFAMGPILLGLVVPEGPPLGTSLIAKMETVTCGFLYPIYLAVSGLQTDVFKINIQSTWIVTIIVIAGFVVKIGGVMLPGYYYNVPMKECFMIGLLLNGRGIAELTMYNIWKEGK